MQAAGLVSRKAAGCALCTTSGTTSAAWSRFCVTGRRWRKRRTLWVVVEGVAFTAGPLPGRQVDALTHVELPPSLAAQQFGQVRPALPATKGTLGAHALIAEEVASLRAHMYCAGTTHASVPDTGKPKPPTPQHV
jgi:hypothetical protein